MLKSRTETWAALIVGAVGLVVAAIAGLWAYVSATPPLHQNTADVPSATDSAPSPRWTDAVGQGRQIARAGLVAQNLPGLSIAVGVDGDIVWAEGFGWANLEKRTRVAPETRFRIGTASTVLTSAAVGLLLEKGRLKLDEEIQTYVPAFPRKQWPVTLRQLMGHTAGVRNDGGDEGPLLSAHCEQPVEALPHFAEQSLLSEPGTQYRYSSYGWIVVSAAVEAAAGEPFLRFMRNQVFEPLEMDETKPDSATESDANLATPYFPRFAADPRYGPDPMRPTRLFLLRGVERLSFHAVRPGALRDGDQQRQAAATRHGPIAPDAPATGLGAGDRVRARLGSRKRDAGGSTDAGGRPRRRLAGREGGVPHDVPRARDRRVRRCRICPTRTRLLWA